MGIVVLAGKASSSFMPSIVQDFTIPYTIVAFNAGDVSCGYGIQVSANIGSGYSLEVCRDFNCEWVLEQEGWVPDALQQFNIKYGVQVSKDFQIKHGIRVSNDVNALYSIRGYVGQDFNILYGINATADTKIVYGVRVEDGVQFLWRIGPCMNDINIPYSIRHIVERDFKIKYELSPVRAFQNFELNQGLDVSRDFNITYKIRDLLKGDFNILYGLVLEAQNDININYDVNTFNPVHTDYKFVYTLYDPVSEVIPTTVDVTIDGIDVDVDNIQIEIDEDSYCWAARLNLLNLESFMQAVPGTELLITLGTDEYKFIIDSRNRIQSWGSNTYLLQARSPSSVLGDGALPIYKTWDSISALDALTELAGGIAFDFQMIDWIFPDNVLSSEGELPIEIIDRIVRAAGGILSTKKDGSLLMQYKYKQAPPEFDITNVDFTISDLDDIFKLSEERVTKPKYNQVYVSNEPDTDATSIRLEQVEINTVNLTALIRAFVYPFTDSLTLYHSYDATVNIVPQTNPITQEMDEEVIEIVDGKGSVVNPVFAIVETEYLKEDLGAVSFSNSTISTASLGTSLLRIKYQSQFHDFLVDTNSVKQVQVYTED